MIITLEQSAQATALGLNQCVTAGFRVKIFKIMKSYYAGVCQRGMEKVFWLDF